MLYYGEILIDNGRLKKAKNVFQQNLDNKELAPAKIGWYIYDYSLGEWPEDNC